MAMYLSKGRYQIAPHINILNKKLLDVAGGRTKRLIVNMPPRHGKSELISRYFPAWYLGTYPDRRIILVSYEAGFAASWGRKTKELLEEHGDDLFGIKLNRLSNSAYRWDVSGHEGGLNATGVGGAITGKGANVLIIDDPVKNDEQANSKTYRDKTFDWFRATAYTRLEPDGAIIVIMTRWHFDDLAGRLVNDTDSDDKWEVLSFPAIAKENDMLGREEGEPLWKLRYPEEKLQNIKNQIGSYWFSALYQQQPIATEYQIFKNEWWKEYEEEPTGSLLVQSWDTAFKEKQQNDFSVCTTWLLSEKGYFLIDYWRAKVLFPDLQRQVIMQYHKHKPNVVLIEDAASGQSLIQVLQRETKIPIKAIPAIKDKVTRAHLITPLLEAGKVFIPKNAQFLADIINECSEFPYGNHDDIVDSITQALDYLRKRSSNGKNLGLLTKYDRKKENYFTTY